MDENIFSSSKLFQNRSIVVVDDNPRFLQSIFAPFRGRGLRLVRFRGIDEFAHEWSQYVSQEEIKGLFIDASAFSEFEYYLETSAERLKSALQFLRRISPVGFGDNDHIPIVIYSATDLHLSKSELSRLPPNVHIIAKRDIKSLEGDKIIKDAVLPSDRPAFSFGLIVSPISKGPEGSYVRLIEPAYGALAAELIRNPQLFYDISPRTWEEVIADIYLRNGFDDVVLTPRSGDLGRDVVAIKHGFGSVKFIEQVKAYKPGHTVSADEVRALAGVLSVELDTSKAVFTTTSRFAPRLKTDRLLGALLPHRLELIDGEDLVRRLREMTNPGSA